ncbi:MAG: hypothetical protein PHQ23_10565 [Candidatus Wallbacteria bacterium]|nr:hypothetical protein [Candidatus Wallbacteria bacterium]
MKILEKGTPTHDEKDIIKIVKGIYEKGKREDAERIIDTYARRGIHFLRPVWEELHKNEKAEQ